MKWTVASKHITETKQSVLNCCSNCSILQTIRLQCCNFAVAVKLAVLPEQPERQPKDPYLNFHYQTGVNTVEPNRHPRLVSTCPLVAKQAPWPARVSAQVPMPGRAPQAPPAPDLLPQTPCQTLPRLDPPSQHRARLFSRWTGSSSM